MKYNYYKIENIMSENYNKIDTNLSNFSFFFPCIIIIIFQIISTISLEMKEKRP